jgi:hypothetical protein
MKRKHFFGICGLLLIALVGAYSQKPQTSSREVKLTTAQQKEYQQLVRSRAGKTAIETWARKHKLRIISLKDYDIVIPEPAFEHPNIQEASNCDATRCPVATGSYSITNTLGKITGYQAVRCTAKSCKWIKDSQGRYQRICGDWKCENEGPPISTID